MNLDCRSSIIFSVMVPFAGGPRDLEPRPDLVCTCDLGWAKKLHCYGLFMDYIWINGLINVDKYWDFWAILSFKDGCS